MHNNISEMGADLIDPVMVEVHDKISRQEAGIIGSIHEEILREVPEERAGVYAGMIKEIMGGLDQRSSIRLRCANSGGMSNSNGSSDKAKYKEQAMFMRMKRLSAHVSGSVQKTGYRARVIDFATMLGLKGVVENLEDGRVKITAEGDPDKLKWFEEAINIHDNLIQVSSIEREYSEPRGDFSKFYKLVEKGETDSRLDTAASLLNNLIGAVNNLNNNLGGKMDVMIGLQTETIDLQKETIDLQKETIDLQKETIDLQKETLNSQENLLQEVRESRKDLTGFLEQRFEKLESQVAEMRAAMMAKGII